VSWRGGEPPVRRETKKVEEPEGSIAMELADILFVVICLATLRDRLGRRVRGDDAKGHLPRRRSLDQEGTLTSS